MSNSMSEQSNHLHVVLMYVNWRGRGGRSFPSQPFKSLNILNTLRLDGICSVAPAAVNLIAFHVALAGTIPIQFLKN